MTDLATTIHTTLVDLSTCMAAQVTGHGGGPLGRVCLLVPGLIAQDDCCDGQYAMTVNRLYPSKSLPNEDPGTMDSRCGPPYVVADLTAQVDRCAPTIDEHGRAPSCDALGVAQFTWLKDGLALRTGAGCCLLPMFKNNPQRIMGFGLRALTPIGPDGDCVGVALSLWVAFNSCICPD